MATNSRLQTQTNSQPASDGSPVSDVSRSSFLAFKLGREEYGIPVETVQEIHAYVEPKRILNAPCHVTGVIDLRGSIAPAVDLRQVFKAPPSRNHLPPTVISLRLGNDLVGVIVDTVSGVLELTSDQVLPVPRPNNATDADMLLGIGAIGGRFLILVDVAKILSGADLGLIATVLH